MKGMETSEWKVITVSMTDGGKEAQRDNLAKVVS